MNIQLLFLILATCLAEEATPDEEYDDLENYALFQVKFSDILFMNPLDNDLMLNKRAAIPCYKTLKEKVEGFAMKYKKDIGGTQRYYMDIDLPYRQHATNILKTFKKLSEDFVECQELIWGYLKKNENMQGFHTIINCKTKLNGYYDKYEAELELIKDRINKHRIRTKMNMFRDDVKNKFKKATEEYKSCVAEYPQN